MIRALLFFGIVQLLVFSTLLLKSSQHKRSKDKYLNIVNFFFWLSFFLSFCFGALTLITGTRTPIFFVSFSFFVGLVIVRLRYRNPPIKLILFSLLIVGCLVTLASLSITGFHPVGSDPPRFFGFGRRIIVDGNWIPGRYYEPFYGALFPALSGYIAMISLVTGLDLLSGVPALIVINLGVILGISAYISVSNLSGDSRAGLFGTILAFTTPVLSTLIIFTQNIGYVFYFLFMAILSIYVTRRSMRASLFLMILVTSVGIQFHATFSLATMVPVVGLAIFSREKNLPKLKGMALIVSVISLVYWVYLGILGGIINPAETFLESFSSILFGGAQISSPASSYFTSSAPSYLAYAWTFLPALSAALVFSYLIKKKRKRNKGIEIPFYMVAGFLFFAYLISKFVVGRLSRYLQVAWPVALIGGAIGVYKIYEKWENNKIITGLIACLVAFSIFSAVHSREYSPDVYDGSWPDIGRRPVDWDLAEYMNRTLPEDRRLGFIDRGGNLHFSPKNTPFTDLSSVFVYFQIGYQTVIYDRYGSLRDRIYLCKERQIEKLNMNISTIYTGSGNVLIYPHGKDKLSTGSP
ncbi:hypothetical protein AKJ65_04025 [candidate division MSBL1 archaeon SCGC-AAA259E19]|uniref:Uncharacterized protein n=1 Tax=candidate division MSBL1 archaeon SCGC-AAA259E19 TaxID=1698264 RepID=A0A133UK72_9EURY|nr:hypothetical protein AKJ65_04025 [candidate division MSBL1 archaeon SCGC-AAA259E19]